MTEPLTRPPWRKVTSIVRLRAGWAVFLECRGHIMFVDTLGGAFAKHGAEAPEGVGPKRVRCRTCAELARPQHRERSEVSQKHIDAVLRGEELRNNHVTGLVEQVLQHRARTFRQRVRRLGVEDAMAAVAEACARKRRAG